MPVRLRITLMFSVLAFIILGLVCSGIYYFSYTARIATIKTRLTNHAITTGRLLSQRETFDPVLVQRIDSSTTMSLRNNAVQAYDHTNKKIYNYSDIIGDTVLMLPSMLLEAREKGRVFSTIGKKEVVAYNYMEGNVDLVVVTSAEDYEGRENLIALRKVLLLGFLIGNAFILLAGYFFSASLLIPVKRISRDVAEISAQNLMRRIQTGTTRDEWYELSSTLNGLLNRLQESFELQRRFIANASHELSTPLTAISSQLEVSLQRTRDAEEYRKVMQSIYSDVQHTNKLSQTLLEMAKASGDPGGLEIALVRIDEILLRLPSEIVKTDPAFSVLLNFGNLPENEDALLVYGNEPLLFTAIKNVVVNACKYSPRHLAEVGLSVASGLITVQVENMGPPIPQEEQDLIFQPFYRIGQTSHRGFGLGLSLASRIMKIHKGTITVQSSEGSKTIFQLTLPAASTLPA